MLPAGLCKHKFLIEMIRQNPDKSYSLAYNRYKCQVCGKRDITL